MTESIMHVESHRESIMHDGIPGRGSQFRHGTGRGTPIHSVQSRSVSQTSFTMASFFSKTSLASHFSSRSQKTGSALSLPRRAYHVDLGDREKALLAEDPTLRQFKSEKKAVRRIKRISDVLTIAIVAGCAYEFYVRTVVREEERKQAGGKA